MGTRQLRSRGFVLIAVLLLLLLLSGVAVSLMYMVNTEGRVGGNDLENGVAYHASEAGMEKLTADLANLFSSNQAPTPAAIAALAAAPPAISGVQYPEYNIVVPTNPDGTYKSKIDTISAGPNQGLYAQIIPMTLSVTAQRPQADQVRMVRGVEVALIPVFQFGVFSESDLSYFPGPNFSFAGRVHTNGNLFLASGANLEFGDKVQAVGQVVRAQLSNGTPVGPGTSYPGTVLIPDAPNGCPPNTFAASGTCINLASNQGSVVAGPNSALNGAWTSISEGTYNSYVTNGLTGATNLSMPFTGAGVGPVQIIRRPAPGELPSSTVGASRLYNEAQVRILISDDPTENHPDGSPVDAQDVWLASVAPASPLYAKLTANQKSANTAFMQNGIAVSGAAGTFFFGEAQPVPLPNPSGNGAIGKDVDFLPPLNYPVGFAGIGSNLFASTGATEWPEVNGFLRVEIEKADGTYQAVTQEILGYGFARNLFTPTAGTPNNINPRAILIFQQPADRDGNGAIGNGNVAPVGKPTIYESTTYTGAGSQYNWFPINFYDPREGEVRDVNNGTTCTANGVMNAVELDVNNLRQYLAGSFGGTGASVNTTAQNGYVLYFSDRRGMMLDANTAPLVKTGESGIEDVVNSADPNGVPNNLFETAEDVDGNGKLDNWGMVNIGDGFGLSGDTETVPPNPFKTRMNCLRTARKNRVTGARRVLRLVDGARGQLPMLPGGTGGFTVASENPVYVLGDYNASLADHAFVDANHAAAAVIADSVTLLSNNWTDLNGFTNPNSPGNRAAGETYYRVAIAAGKNLSFTKPAGFGSQDFGTDGGVHNFLRYIESWPLLHYQGSLVSLYYSQYSTGIFKCCTVVYSPPTRDYSFDVKFLNPANLPPGTPMFRDVDNVSYRQDLTPY